MNAKHIAIAAGAFIALACNQGATMEQKKSLVMAERNQVYADLARHEGECKATAIEFPDDRKILEACLETHRFMVDNARGMIEKIDQRIEQIDRTGR